MFTNISKNTFRPQALQHDIISRCEISLHMALDSNSGLQLSGNKYFKLKPNIDAMKRGQFERLLTFGGAFSNHIAATALMCNELGISAIGIIRGDELNATSNKTLKEASDNGMELHFVSRSEYANRHQPHYWQHLKVRFGNIFIVPEGGANHAGVHGCAAMTEGFLSDFDTFIVPVGTGATFAGVRSSLHKPQRAIGVLVHKDTDSVQMLLDQLATENLAIGGGGGELVTEFNFGGYGRSNAELDNFCKQFHNDFAIKIEPIYTGKMMFAVFKLMQEGFFQRGERILCYHTGGLQYL